MNRAAPPAFFRGLALWVLAGIAALAVSGCAFRSGGAKKTSYPDYSNYVNDTADIVSPEMESALNRLATDLDTRTGAQVAVLTVPTTEPETLEQYAVAVFEKWGVGKKDKDNGVLLLVAPDNPKDNRIRIEVGYGLEGALTDIQSKHIITGLMAPACRTGDMDACVANGVFGIISLVATEYDLALTSSGALVARDQAGAEAFDSGAAPAASASSEEYSSPQQTESAPARGRIPLFKLIFYRILGIAALILLITNPQL